jgi:hypothetical protein
MNREQTLRFELGWLTFCEDTGVMKVISVDPTDNPDQVRELVETLETVITMMEMSQGVSYEYRH